MIRKWKKKIILVVFGQYYLERVARGYKYAMYIYIYIFFFFQILLPRSNCRVTRTRNPVCF